MTESVPIEYISGLFDGGVDITLRIREDNIMPCGYDFDPGLRFETTDSPELVGALIEFSEQNNVMCDASQDSDSSVWFVTGTSRVRVLLMEIEDHIWAETDNIDLMIKEILPRLENNAHHTEDGILELMKYVEQLDWRQRFNQYNRYTRSTFEDEFFTND